MRLLAIIIVIAIIVFVVWAVRNILTARRRSMGWQITERANRWGRFVVQLEKPGQTPVVIRQIALGDLHTPEGQSELWEARAEAHEAKIVLDNRE